MGLAQMGHPGANFKPPRENHGRFPSQAGSGGIVNGMPLTQHQEREAAIAEWIAHAEKTYANPRSGRDMNDAEKWKSCSPEQKRSWALMNLAPFKPSRSEIENMDHAFWSDEAKTQGVMREMAFQSVGMGVNR